MASAWCKETDKKINYTKLCRLLVDGGTQAARSVFDSIHLPATLKTTLNTHKTTLQKLKKPKGKVLNNEQWDKLYPPSGSNPSSKDFDITLLFVLLRNICGLTSPATGWDVLPPTTDRSQEANLARIKYYRNNTISHKPSTEIDDADFKQYWQNISSAVLSLGLKQEDIDNLESATLGGKDYNQLLYHWYVSDEDIKTQLVDVKAGMADIKTGMADIKADATAIKDGVNKLNIVYAETHKQDDHIKKLAFSDFKREISTRCKSFQPNTRQWILNQVKSYTNNKQPESCIMLITAGPGMGKSTVAAKICKMYKDLGCLGGCHFFQFNNSTRNNPRLMLQSIARQMCDTVPGYQDALEEKLQTDLGKKISEMKCEELLTILLEEPLCNLEQIAANFVIVIDALDECSYDLKNELMAALKTKLRCLPSWLRFIITSRPSTDTSVLGSTMAEEINPDNEYNLQDLEKFFCCELEALGPQNSNAYMDLVPKLVQMTQAFFVVDLLRTERVTSPEKVLELFPNGISSVYENYFSRLKEVLLPYISEEERFYKMLEAIVATEDPLPKNMVYDILGLKNERDVPRTKKQARKDAINSLHWLFPVKGGHMTALHKSVVDWLTLEEHDFSVRVEDGNEILINQCDDKLSDIRNGKEDLDKPLDLTDSEKYALRFVACFRASSSIVKKNLSNLYILTAMVSEDTKRIDSFYYRGFINSLEFNRLFMLCRATFANTTLHMGTCPYNNRVKVGHYLEFVLQAARDVIEITEETTPKPLDALKEYHFTYYKDIDKLSTPSCPDISLFNKGFIIPHLEHLNSQTTTALTMYQVDGRPTFSKSFVGQRKIASSPNIKFIVVTEEKGSNIEILDVTTLEVVSQYHSPRDAIQTCHMFGDDGRWYIVIQGCNDNMVYVIEGLTGQVHNVIKVNEGSKVIDVSCQGHIVVTRICDEPEERSAFTNHLLNKLFAYREMYLYHYEHAQEAIPIYPFAEVVCHFRIRRSNIMSSYELDNKAVRFSQDGRLLAYQCKNSIFVVKTSDGSLFKRLSFRYRLNPWSRYHNQPLEFSYISFISEYFLVICDKNCLVFINVQTDEIEHTVYFPVIDVPKDVVLIPHEVGESFTLLVSLPTSTDSFVIHLIIQNLGVR